MESKKYGKRAIILLIAAIVSGVLTGFLFYTADTLVLGYILGIVTFALILGLIGTIVQLIRSSKSNRGGKYSASFWAATTIADLVIAAPVAYAAWDDAQSTGMFAGLGAALLLIFVIPVLAVFFIISVVMLIISCRKQKMAALEAAAERETRGNSGEMAEDDDQGEKQ